VYAPASFSNTNTSTNTNGPELARVPLWLIARAGSCVMRLAELKLLELRDVIVLDQSSLIHDGRRFGGQVMVHVAGSGTHLICHTSERGLEVESVTSMKEPQMTNGRLSQSPEPRATVPDLAADAPLELSVELARFSLTLGELQRTGPGDVLLTGRAIGEVVTLRVAGTALAEGELVDVEGEVGVRITRFLTTP
jgi:type III secretion system YscQ/HrcQ family protein